MPTVPEPSTLLLAVSAVVAERCRRLLQGKSDATSHWQLEEARRHNPDVMIATPRDGERTPTVR